MSNRFASLDRTLTGRAHRPGTPGFDAACAGFDLAAIPSPDPAVSATTEADVTTAMRFAAEPDGRAVDAGRAFDEPDFTRLRHVKAAWDRANRLFRFNVNMLPSGSLVRSAA